LKVIVVFFKALPPGKGLGWAYCAANKAPFYLELVRRLFIHKNCKTAAVSGKKNLQTLSHFKEKSVRRLKWPDMFFCEDLSEWITMGIFTTLMGNFLLLFQ
jgi:hypothetical protein